MVRTNSGRTGLALALALVAGVVAGAVGQPVTAQAAVAGVGTVAAYRLNVRTGPSTNYRVVRVVARNAKLYVVCRTPGELVSGTMRTTSFWDRLSDGRFVTDAYVRWAKPKPAIPLCSVPAGGATTLILRRNASTLLAPAGTVSAVALVEIMCQVEGQRIYGPTRNSNVWDRLTSGYFVADAQLLFPGGRPAIPWCTFSAPMPPAVGEPFVVWAASFAQATARTYRVPASVSIAQAILESGWGRSGLTRDGNSFFGMKCFGTPGTIALGCRTYNTHECTPAGKCYATTASFRVYRDSWSSFNDHGYMLASLTRYRNAFKYVNNPNQFAIEIHKAGYATGTTYSASLIALMRRYNLYRFDRPIPTP